LQLGDHELLYVSVRPCVFPYLLMPLLFTC